MQSINIAVAATMLATILGTAPAAASHALPGGTLEQADIVQIDHRGDRERHKRDWDDDDDDDRRKRHRHGHHRVRCHTEWVLAYTRYGPDWYPVRVCHRRPRHW